MRACCKQFPSRTANFSDPLGGEYRRQALGSSDWNQSPRGPARARFPSHIGSFRPQAEIVEMNPVTGNDRRVERRAWLRIIPAGNCVNLVPIAALRYRRPQAG